MMKGIDELYGLFKKRKRIPLKEAAALLKVGEDTAMQFAEALREDEIIDIEKKGGETILAWRGAAPRPPESKEALRESEAEFRAIVSEYERRMEEVRRKNTELQDLAKERAQIIYTRYIPLERKFEAELQLLHDQLADKEREIGELDKRIRDMPGKVASIEEHAKRLEQIESYARKNIAESKVKVNAATTRISDVQASIETHLKEVSLRMEEQTLKLKIIEKELIRLKKIEQWMEMQQSELERRLAEVSATRKASIKQYSVLRATVSADYIRGYLKELAALKDRHAREVYEIRKKEEELNEKVRLAKKELTGLTDESRLLVERFEKLSKKRRIAHRAAREFDDERKRFEQDIDALSAQNIE